MFTTQSDSFTEAVKHIDTLSAIMTLGLDLTKKVVQTWEIGNVIANSENNKVNAATALFITSRNLDLDGFQNLQKRAQEAGRKCKAAEDHQARLIRLLERCAEGTEDKEALRKEAQELTEISLVD